MNETTILELPLEVLVNIFDSLNVQDLCSLMRCCKKLKTFIIHSNTIWRRKTRNKLVLYDPPSSDCDPLCWYKRCRISHNWCKGICKNQIVLHHDTRYMPWLEFYKSKFLLLALGSDLFCFPTDKRGFPYCRTALWALDVPTIKRYDVRTNDISRFVIRDNILLCGNRDGCISVFLLNDLKKKPLLLYHINDCHNNGEVEVSAVEAIKTESNLCLLTGSHKSSQLCMWSWNFANFNSEHMCDEIKNMNCSKTTKTISEEVGIRCLATKNNKVAIGLNGNMAPVLFDIHKCLFQLPVHVSKNRKCAIRDIQWHDENTIASVSHSGVLQLTDIRNGQVIYDSKDPFGSSLYCVKSDGNNALVVGASEYSRCVLFDARRPGRHVQIYFTQKKTSPIYSLDFNSSKLIAAADRSIATVNFDVNPAIIKQRDYSDVFEFI